jgi:hypothetical protein
LVLLGQVAITRRDATEPVLVGPGVDVANVTVRSLSGVKPSRSASRNGERVKALLVQFGQ